ncbi:MAG: substrate-binding domain-containing protein [Anaerolineae bacterium]|nr:substrate-binding domain-containing protein [Anaerolineae bacterium]
MRQSKTLFFAIIGLAILAVIGILLARPFLAEPLNLPTEAKEITIRVVVAPSIKPWAEQAALEFNQAHPKTQVELITADNLIPKAQFTANPQVEPPAVWLAEATFVVDMDSDMQFANRQSVASTALAWGAFNNKQAEFSQKYGGLNWEALHQSATEPDSVLKVVIASPHNTAAGLGALASAAAAHLNQQTLTGAEVNRAEAWLSETFQESARASLNLGPRPAEAFATRGASIGDVGMLAQVSWRSAGLQNRPDFTITPAQPTVVLDYPFAIWTGSRATPEAQQAAADFRDFLLTEAQQNTLVNFYLDQAGAADPNAVQVDGQAALALFRWAERELR